MPWCQRTALFGGIDPFPQPGQQMALPAVPPRPSSSRSVVSRRALVENRSHAKRGFPARSIAIPNDAVGIASSFDFHTLQFQYPAEIGSSAGAAENSVRQTCSEPMVAGIALLG